MVKRQIPASGERVSRERKTGSKPGCRHSEGDEVEREAAGPSASRASRQRCGESCPLAGFGECDEDDLDLQTFDPLAGDVLGDFGLDDDEAVPDADDFWFEDEDRFDD